MSINDWVVRYKNASHAIQTGVKFDHERGSTDGTPKHLRVGLNLSKTDMAGLVKLLIQKGILTEEEYLETITLAAEAEVKRYEELLSKGDIKITLL